jgi:ferredoxin-fold anticodon binding domain-containing protein
MQANANPESFQAQYERLVENWLTKFAQINQELLKNLELSVVDEKGEKQTLYGTNESGDKVCDISPEQIQKIESGELKANIEVAQTLEKSRISSENVKVYTLDEMGESELVYGKAGLSMINRMSQQRIEELRKASTAEVGNKVESEPLKVKLGDEVIFQVDESGQVLVNESKKLQQVLTVLDEPIKEQQQQPNLDDYYEDYDSSDFAQAQEDVWVELISELVENLPNPVQSEPELEVQNDLDEFFQVDLQESTSIRDEALVILPAEEQEKQEDTPQKTGLDCVEEAVSQLGDGSLKTVLTQATQELRMEVSSQPPNPELDQLMAARTQAPQDPNWWQETTSKIEEMVTAVRDSFVGNRAASTLKRFADKLDLQFGESYEGAEYNLQRQGKDYTLTDKQGNELLKFKSSVLGVKVDNTLLGLDDRDAKKIEGLRKYLSRGVKPQGAFVSEGKAEAEYFKRVTAITSALSLYAAQTGGTAKVEGKFSYDWQANSSGSVMIKNKQGEVLLACGQGQLRSRMSQKDLQHFEQMAPSLQETQRSRAGQMVTAQKGKHMEI